MMQLSVQQLDDLRPDAGLGWRWEQLVQAAPASGLMQSLHWAAFKRTRGLRVLHLGLFAADELIGGALLYAPATAQPASLLIAPEGPVLPWEQPEIARAGLRLLRSAALERASKYAAVGMRIEPLLPTPRPPLLRDWGRAPVDLLARETLLLDLTQSEAELLAAMRPKCRYNIRLAERHGVHVRSSTAEHDIPLFYALLDEAGERDDFYVEPIDHFSDLLRMLAPHGLARLLIAEYAGAALGALLLTTYGQRAVYLYGGTATSERNKMAGYALQWAAITSAKAAGCASYDFYGYDASGNPQHQYANFSRFKRGFGGTPRTFIGAHDFYWPDRLADAVVRAVHALR